MKNFVLLLVVSSSFILASCSKERNFDKTKDKLVGTWRYDCVRLMEDSKWFNDDVTDQFKKYRWVFTEGGDAMRIEPGTTDTAFGTYELVFQGYDIYDIEFTMVNRNVDPNIVDRMKWCNVEVNKKRFRADQTIDKTKWYTYGMKKE